MFELTVKTTSNCTNVVSHSEIKIIDLETKKCYVVSFGPEHSSVGSSSSHKIQAFDDSEQGWRVGCYQPEKVVLFSNLDKTLDDFIKTIERRCDCFELACNNCSDATNFTLNYFFPRSKNPGTEALWQTYKCVTFPFCIATFGLTPFFGAPPLFNAPQDILKKAKLLSRYYGDHKKLPIISSSRIAEISDAPEGQAMTRSP